jgi:hypothetical protein
MKQNADYKVDSIIHDVNCYFYFKKHHGKYCQLYNPNPNNAKFLLHGIYYSQIIRIV